MIDPGPDDAIIGFKIECSKSQPGLDGTWDRVVRISFRPGRNGPMPKGKKPQPPNTGKSPGGGGEGRGAFPPQVKPGAPASGVEVAADGTVYIDVVLYGQPKPGALGDDSEDMAGRIAEAVDEGIKEGKINAGDISVEHNGFSDIDPKWGAQDPRHKPIDTDAPRGSSGGRGRCVIKGATHVDASSNDGKIEFVIILPSTGTVDLSPTLPNWVPSPRNSYKWIDPSTDKGSKPQTPTIKKRKQSGEPFTNPPSIDYTRDTPWGRPRPPRTVTFAAPRYQDPYNIPPKRDPEISVELSGDWGQALSRQSWDSGSESGSSALARALAAVGLQTNWLNTHSVAYRIISERGLAGRSRLAVGLLGVHDVHFSWELSAFPSGQSDRLGAPLSDGFSVGRDPATDADEMHSGRPLSDWNRMDL